MGSSFQWKAGSSRLSVSKFYGPVSVVTPSFGLVTSPFLRIVPSCISGKTAWMFMNNQNATFDEKLSFQLKRYHFSLHKMSMNLGSGFTGAPPLRHVFLLKGHRHDFRIG
jgi:hypothetical protein